MSLLVRKHRGGALPGCETLSALVDPRERFVDVFVGDSATAQLAFYAVSVLLGRADPRAGDADDKVDERRIEARGEQ